MNKCYLIADQRNCLYLLVARYYIDEHMYLHVLSVKNKNKRRNYKLYCGGSRSFIGVCGGPYLRLPVKAWYGDSVNIKLTFEFL